MAAPSSGFHVPDRVDPQTLASCPACRCLIRAFLGPRGRTVRWDYWELGDRKRVVEMLKNAGVPVGPFSAVRTDSGKHQCGPTREVESS